MHERLVETPRFYVERRRYSHKDGGELVRDVVVHPGAVVVLPILSEWDGQSSEHIVLIRQLRRSVGKKLWELPAGTREPDETAIDTARRELIEETGFQANRLEPLATFYTSPGITDELMHAFVATGLVEIGQRLERGEEIEVEAMETGRVREMLRQGVIQDGKTLAVLGLHFAQRG